MSHPPTTLVCQLTPPGRSAVAVIEVVGEQASSILNRCFRSSSFADCGSIPEGRVCYGMWQDEGERGEDVVLVRLGEQAFEVHGHGGWVAPRKILDRLQELGCHEISAWQRLLRSEPSTLVAEAKWLSSQAPGLAAATLSQWQVDGIASETLAAWRNELQNQSSHGSDWLKTQVHAVLSRESLVTQALHGSTVMLVGPANAGKSSLLNAFVGYQRAIVFDEPGTTRDLVQSTIMLDGWPLRLIDTAGERESASNDLEREGQRRAKALVSSADLVLRLVDGVWASAESKNNQGLGSVAEDSHPRSSDKAERWWVLSKRDRISVEQRQAICRQLTRFQEPVYATSTLEAQGTLELYEALQKWVSREMPSEPCLLPMTERQGKLLREFASLIHCGATAEALESLDRLEKSPDATEPSI